MGREWNATRAYQRHRWLHRLRNRRMECIRVRRRHNSVNVKHFITIRNRLEYVNLHSLQNLSLQVSWLLQLELLKMLVLQ